MLQCPQENPSSTTVLASICMSSQPPSLINCEAIKCHELVGSISLWQGVDHCTQAQTERERERKINYGELAHGIMEAKKFPDGLQAGDPGEQ